MSATSLILCWSSNARKRSIGCVECPMVKSVSGMTLRSDHIIERIVKLFVFGANAKLGLFEHDRCVRFHTACQPHARADDGIVPDHGLPAQNGGIGVNHYAIFKRGMAFGSAHEISITIHLKAERT